MSALPQAPAPEDARRERRRRQLIEAAVDGIAAQGLRETTVQEVAKRAGMAVGSISQYFTSKEQLFTALLVALADEFEACWRAGLDRSGIDVLLWCALARELPIAPSARFFGVYFVDLARGLILHSYDDRGMDLAAVSPGDLSAFEAEFGPWLLSTGERR